MPRSMVRRCSVYSVFFFEDFKLTGLYISALLPHSRRPHQGYSFFHRHFHHQLTAIRLCKRSTYGPSTDRRTSVR